MPSLFLSHSSVDKPFVEKLATGLERVGVDVWYDKWAINVGDSLTERINEGVEENEYLGFVLSPDALVSGCRQMNSRKVIILPILYRDCEVPDYFAGRKYADFRTNYEQGFLELCATLGLKRAESITESNWRLFIGGCL